MSIAFLDVDYRGIRACAACVLTDSWEAESPSATYMRDIEAVQPYEPGYFYRRELPCLVAVLGLLPALPEIVVIDGYVWLSSMDRPGLGAHLYEALGRCTPVVGIAKTVFHGVESSDCIVPVFRGASRKPLFVSAVGIEPVAAARCVRQMAGKHRIPVILKTADRLCKKRPASGERSG